MIWSSEQILPNMHCWTEASDPILQTRSSILLHGYKVVQSPNQPIDGISMAHMSYFHWGIFLSLHIHRNNEFSILPFVVILWQSFPFFSSIFWTELGTLWPHLTICPGLWWYGPLVIPTWTMTQTPHILEPYSRPMSYAPPVRPGPFTPDPQPRSSSSLLRISMFKRFISILNCISNRHQVGSN
jgi:hypothetical protein